MQKLRDTEPYKYVILYVSDSNLLILEVTGAVAGCFKYDLGLSSDIAWLPA